MIPPKKRLSLGVHPKRGTPFMRSSLFTVYRYQNKLDHNRLAAIIGKRAAALATTRHTLKREVMQIMNRWPEKGYDIILILQKGFVELTKTKRSEALQTIKNKLS